MKFMKDMRERRLDAHEGGMPGFMKPECAAECPGAADLSAALMTMMAEAMATTPPPDAPAMSPEEQAAMAQEMMMTLLCDHADALKCMSTTAACADGRRLKEGNATSLDEHEGHAHEEDEHEGHAHEEESGDDGGMGDMGMIMCMCKCKEIAVLATVAPAIEAGGGVLPKDMCPTLEAAMTCMVKQEECAPAVTAMAADEEGATAVAMSCGQGIAAKAGVKVKPPPPFVEVSFKVEGVNLTDLSEKQTLELTATYALSIAEAAGVDPKLVKVMLSQGSIKVDAKVMAKDEAGVAAKLAAPEAKTAMAKATTESEVLKEVVVAKGGSVDDLVVGDIVAEVKTPTLPPAPPTTTAAPAEDGPATTSSALAQVAPGLAMVAAIVAA